MAEKEQDREFIRQKIVRPPMSGKDILKRAVLFAGLGVLFGGISAVTFTAVKPLAEQKLGMQTPQTETAIEFTADVPETTLSPAESRAAETAQSQEAKRQLDEAVDKAVDQAMSSYTVNGDMLQAFYGAVQEIGKDVDPGVVTVHSGVRDEDIFGNEVESSGSQAGAVIAITPEEILIFTGAEGTQEADSLKVAFADGTVAPAELKGCDSLMHMAVVSVRPENVPEETISHTEVLPLGNSFQLRQGDFILGIGAPAGRMHSVTGGTIASIEDNVSVTDGVGRIMYADIPASTEKVTFFINMAGEIIGWAVKNTGSTENSGLTEVCGISGYKKQLTDMSNGEGLPYFGARFRDVNETMQNTGMPEGAYITEAVPDGPAYQAGIQNGDIIVAYGEEPVLSQGELRTRIENSHPEDTVRVKVMRAGREEYREIEFEVKIAER